MHGFMFATGIENSYPTIAGGVRIDQMEKCGHYARLGARPRTGTRPGHLLLALGAAPYRTFPGPGRYDWAWTDDVMEEMRQLDIQPIMDLCHFGVPDWLGNFQNADFPRYFAEYAGACAAVSPRPVTGLRSTRSSSPRCSRPSTVGGMSG